MKALTPGSTFDYIDEIDKDLPVDEQTVFICKYLTTAQRQILDDAIGYQTDEGLVLTLGTSNLLAIHLGLAEIRNFHDAQGNPVELKRDKKAAKRLPGVGRPWDLEVIDLIPKDVLDRVAKAIKNGGELDEDEAKN